MTTKRTRPEFILPGKEKYLENKLLIKNFVKQEEGADLYSLSVTKFRELADEAGAVYKVDKNVLINIEAFEKNLENYRVWSDK